jgi:hypothetical protein
MIPLLRKRPVLVGIRSGDFCNKHDAAKMLIDVLGMKEA